MLSIYYVRAMVVSPAQYRRKGKRPFYDGFSFALFGASNGISAEIILVRRVSTAPKQRPGLKNGAAELVQSSE